MKIKCYDLQKSLRNAKIVSNLWLNLSIQSDFTEGSKQQKYLNTKNFDEKMKIQYSGAKGFEKKMYLKEIKFHRQYKCLLYS